MTRLPDSAKCGLVEARGTHLLPSVQGAQVLQLGVMPKLALLIRWLARLHTHNRHDHQVACEAASMRMIRSPAWPTRITSLSRISLLLHTTCSTFCCLSVLQAPSEAFSPIIGIPHCRSALSGIPGFRVYHRGIPRGHTLGVAEAVEY